jgi:Ribbon-helix-helix protein, copG family
MNERTTVRLPAELLKRAKRKAAAEGRTLTALIEEGLRQVVEEKKEGASRKRKPLPVSKATGGLRPGIDLTRFSDIQHMDDLEYVERMKHFK